MIGKTRKPTVREFRPIAITSVGYKLFWGYWREEIEGHLIKNYMVEYNQIGFTKGGRLEYNHFILQYLGETVRKSYKKEHKNLYMIALDLRKAYDSIDRGRLVEALVEFKIHPALINLIVRVYNGDKTRIRMGGKEAIISITSGIKQGCTASTVFFKLITFIIIKHMIKKEY